MGVVALLQKTVTGVTASPSEHHRLNYLWTIRHGSASPAPQHPNCETPDIQLRNTRYTRVVPFKEEKFDIY